MIYMVKDIPQKIRDARLSSGLTQKQLADALGYKSFQAVQRWELGIRPVPDDKKRALAKLIGLTIDDLIP